MHNATGKWAVSIQSPLGNQSRDMVVEAGVETFTGSVTGPDGTQAVSGKVDGNRLTWSDQVTKPMKLNLKFDVTVEGDEMSGQVKLGIFGSAKFKATRVA